MSEYTPDRWIMLEITSKKLGTIRKIFAGWYGGFMGSDSWKLNSGVVATRIDDSGHYEFTGQSGSVYCCHANTHGMSGYMAQVLMDWRTKYPHIDFKEIELESITES
jgi:hypothetical protein